MLELVKRIVPKSIKSPIKRMVRGSKPVQPRSHESKASLRREFLLQLPKNSICAEIGVDKGEFSEEILNIVQPSKLHLIDPWVYVEDTRYERSLYGGNRGQDQEQMDERFQKVERRFSDAISRGQVVLHRMNSDVAAASFTDHYFDWIYIDGNHLYEFVKSDLETYSRKVKPQGYILGDDYNVKGWWEYGVTRAVDEFVAKNHLELTLRDGQFWIHL